MKGKNPSFPALAERAESLQRIMRRVNLIKPSFFAIYCKTVNVRNQARMPDR